MPFAKTALATEVLQHRSSSSLALRQRTALILFDGKRSIDEVLRQTAGLGVNREDIFHLLDSGLLVERGRRPRNTK